MPTPLRVPACYFAASDETTRRYVVVLEDLRDGRFGSQENGCHLDEPRRVRRPRSRQGA